MNTVVQAKIFLFKLPLSLEATLSLLLSVIFYHLSSELLIMVSEDWHFQTNRKGQHLALRSLMALIKYYVRLLIKLQVKIYLEIREVKSYPNVQHYFILFADVFHHTSFHSLQIDALRSISDTHWTWRRHQSQLFPNLIPLNRHYSRLKNRSSLF